MATAWLDAGLFRGCVQSPVVPTAQMETYRITDTDQRRYEAAPRCPGRVLRKEHSDQNINATSRIPAAIFMLAIHEEMRLMKEVRMPHDTLVLIGDGRKALFLRNHGDEKFPDLRVERMFEDVNPATHDQGTDRPGRAYASAGGGRRSSIAGTDWHDLEEHEFARDVAAALERLVRDSKIKALVIASPPRTLTDLRHALHADVKKCIIAELPKDLTHHPVHEIEKHLAG